MRDEQRPGLPRITKITVTPEGVARARSESMERAGVGVSVTPELLKHAEEQGRKLRAKRQERAATDDGRKQAAEVVVQTVLDDCLEVEYERGDTETWHIKHDTASRIVRGLARSGLMATATEHGREQIDDFWCCPFCDDPLDDGWEDNEVADAGRKQTRRRFSFAVQRGRWQAQGWTLQYWHWQARLCRTYTYRQMTAVAVDLCLGRYALVVTRSLR